MLGEYNDEWMVTRRCMSVGALEETRGAAGRHSSTAELETEEEPMLVEQVVA